MKTTELAFSRLSFSRQAFLIFLMGILASCSQSIGSKEQGHGLVKKDYRSATIPSFSPLKINKVAILSLQADRTLSVTDLDRQFLSKRLGEKIELGTGLKVINLEEPERSRELVSQSERLPQPIQEQARVLGDKLGAQGVFYGVITRFDGDPHSSMKSTQGAGAGFRLWLLETKTGEVVWSATFEKSQQALTDNILMAPSAIREGLRFKSRAQLFDLGFRSVAEDLTLLRKSDSEIRQ